MNPLKPVKAAIWLYFWLLLVEGALRKWIFPEWSDVLFVVRDPVVIVIYLLAWRGGVFPRRPALVVVWCLIALSLSFSFANATPFIVTAFGLRTNYLHLPLVFVMAQVLDRDDLLAFGRWLMICAVPIAGLMFAQFGAPRDHWLNNGAAGAVGGQIDGAMGHIRAPGPFSFISGVVSYVGLTAAFVLSGWIQERARGLLLLIVATVAITVMVPVSVSRALLLTLMAVAAFGLVAAFRDARRLPAYLAPIAVALALMAVASDSAYVATFRARWEDGLRIGGGDFNSSIVDRVVGDLLRPIEVAADAPFFGHGIGTGTVAGSRLTTGKFIFAETESARLIEELGPVLGFAFLGWRIWLSGLIAWKSWRSLRKRGDTLPWMLTAGTILLIIFGQWGQATQLGFAVFSAGLALAAIKERTDAEDEETVEEEDSETEALAKPLA